MASQKLSEKQLGESFECTGVWWLPAEKESEPQNVDRRVYGTLTFSPGKGIVLSTIGDFRSSITETIADLSSPEVFCLAIVLGISSEGEKITLINCRHSGSTISGDFSTSAYDVHQVLAGYHFNNQLELAFDALSLEYTHLGQWSSVSGFKVVPGQELKEFSVTYKKPEDVTPITVNKYKIRLVAGLSYSGKRFPDKISLEQTKRFYVESADSKQIPLDDFNDLTLSIQNFLSLMMMEAIFPLSIDGVKKQRDFQVPIRLFYKSIGGVGKSEGLRPHDIPFTFESISDQFAQLLSRFIDDRGMRSVHNLFFSDFYSPPTYTEERYVSITTFLEAYHRRIRDSKATQELYTNQINRLMEYLLSKELSPDTTNRIRRCLMNAEIPFATRLKDLLAQYGNTFVDLFVGKDNVGGFISDVAVARQYYLTYDPRLQREVTKGAELFFLYSKLKVFGWILLLLQTGMSESLVSEAVSSMSASNFHKLGYLRSQV
jgi:hypothetical protein